MADNNDAIVQNIQEAPENVTKPPATKVPNITPQFIKSQYDAGISVLRLHQYTYARNLSFLDGQQWVYYDKIRNTLVDYPRDPTRTRVVFNRLRPITRALMSRLLSRPLVFQVPPGDSDDGSIRAAHIAEGIIQDLHDEHGWEQLRQDALMCTLIGGTAVIALDWDAQGGDTVGHMPVTGEPVGTGEIKESVLSISEISWEPGNRNPETGLWWIRAQVLPPNEIRERYGLDYEPPRDSSNMTTPLAQTYSRMSREAVNMQLTLVLTYYERPNKMRPEGCVATVVGNRFVDGPKAWPFPFKDHLNLVCMRETKIPNQAAGDTIFSDAVSIQSSYNAVWSIIIEHLKNAGNARLMIPEQALDGIEDLSDVPSEIISYNSTGGEPKWLAPPSMPQWWMEAPQQLAKEIDDILATHEVSRGQMPANIDSGIGLAILLEQDQTPLGKLTIESIQAFEKLAHYCLEIYKAKVKDTRNAKITQLNAIPEIVEWSGKSLEGQLKVIIPPDAVIPRSKASQMAMAQSLWNMKILTDPADFATFADVPGNTDLIQSIDPDTAKAVRENHLFGMGQMQKVADFDDHTKHINKHNAFRKSIRYESLSDDDRAAVDDHIKAHEVMAAEQMGTQVAKAGVHPALNAVPTADGQAPLPPELGLPQTPGQTPPPLMPGTPPPMQNEQPQNQPQMPEQGPLQ